MSRARQIRDQVAAALMLMLLLSLLVLAVAAMVGAVRSAPPAPRPGPTVTVADDRADDEEVIAYNAGWKAGVAALGDGRVPTHPDVVGDAGDPGTVAWADGWIDGQADALGDDNRDGRVDEDESGWDCRTMGNRVCGPAVSHEGDTTAARSRR